MQSATRYHWLLDDSPRPDIQGGVVIGAVSVPTGRALKGLLIGPIGPVDVAAGRASLTRVARVYQDHRHPGSLRLIRDVLAKLVEAPVGMSCTLGLTNRCPRADTLKVFQGHRTFRVFGLFHDMFADDMVGVLLEAGLAARQIAKLAPGRAGALALQVATAMRVGATLLFHFRSAVDFAVRVRGEVHDAQVHTQHVLWLNGGRLFDVTRGVQIKLAVAPHQIRLALAGLQQGVLRFSTGKRDSHTPGHRPDRDGGPGEAPAQDAVIVGDATGGLESALGLFVQLVGIGYLRLTAYCHLRRQAEATARFLVGQSVQLVLPKGFVLPRHGADGVARGVRLFQRSPEGICLIGHRLQLDLRRELHRRDYSTIVLDLKSRGLLLRDVTPNRFRASLPRAADVIALAPQRSVFASVMTVQRVKLLHQATRCGTREQAHDLRRGELGRGRYK